MNVDGSQVKRLTYDRGGDSYPAWSPDSKQIVFNQALQLSVSNSERFDEIAVIDSDGKNVHQLTHNTVIDYAPDWSPDRNKIAFYSGMNGKRGIFVMDPDGKNVKELTSGDKECFHPKWSPDGNQILSYCRVGKVDNIYVMNADGSNIHALFNSPAEESNLAAWSPDGKKIVFVRSVFRNKEWITRLFIGNIDGSNLHQLLVGKDTQNRDDYPFWAP